MSGQAGAGQARTGETKNMFLGSGDLYMMDFTGTVGENSAIETEANMIGGIKGGASIAYNSTLYTVADDMRRFSESIITAEEATFKSGLLKFSLGDIARLALTSTYTKSSSKEELTIGGGIKGKSTLLRFVHTLKDGRKARVTMVGLPKSGFELAFSDTETIVNAEFAGEPMDNSGALIKITIGE